MPFYIKNEATANYLWLHLFCKLYIPLFQFCSKTPFEFNKTTNLYNSWIHTLFSRDKCLKFWGQQLLNSGFSTYKLIFSNVKSSIKIWDCSKLLDIFQIFASPFCKNMEVGKVNVMKNRVRDNVKFWFSCLQKGKKSGLPRLPEDFNFVQYPFFHHNFCKNVLIWTFLFEKCLSQWKVKTFGFWHQSDLVFRKYALLCTWNNIVQV